MAKVQGRVIRDEEVKELRSHMLHGSPRRAAGLGVKEPEGASRNEGKCM